MRMSWVVRRAQRLERSAGQRTIAIPMTQTAQTSQYQKALAPGDNLMVEVWIDASATAVPMRHSRALASVTYWADDMGTMAARPFKVRPGTPDNARASFFTGYSPGRRPGCGRVVSPGAVNLIR